MSVWKKLNSQDAFVSSYNAKKRWDLSASELEGLGIKFLPAVESYTETSCDFKLANCAFKLNEPTVLNCTFNLIATAVDCTIELVATALSSTSTATPLPATNTPSPTSIATATPTPTPDCTLILQATI